MADQKLTQLSEVSLPTLDDLTYHVDDPAGTPVSNKVTWARLLGQFFAATREGRLTTESGVPLSNSDRTAQSTLYFTPFRGNRVALYDGTRWKLYVFTERSLALSGLTSGKPYDVFLYDNAGTLTLELLVWTDDTTRATALVAQDGVWVKTGALTRRYLGTVYTTGTTTTEDSEAKRFVWNAMNRVARAMKRVETAGNWTYSTGTYQQANANAANQLDYVVGLAEDAVFAHIVASVNASATSFVGVAVGVDSTTTLSGLAGGHNFSVTTSNTGITASYCGLPGLGRHFLAWLERGGAGTETWYGNNGGDGRQSGITGVVWG